LNNIKTHQLNLVAVLATYFTFTQCQFAQFIQIVETNKTESIEQVIFIDSVWAGHPVDFCLYTHKNRQYIAYYNANRNMVVGQRDLNDDKFKLYTMPVTLRKTALGTSTVLGWDGHNYVTIGIDREDYLHLSENVHCQPLTYFRSTKPNDISSLEQIYEMVDAKEEKRTTYPHFMLTGDDELLYHYRNGCSGSGNELYNIYDSESKTWNRFLDTPLTDGKGMMNAYQSQPLLMNDGWYHLYWVWRDTPDYSTNHDLSYMKSPDLKNWFDALGSPIELPATIDKRSLIVDPIPVKGGIINLAAKLILDNKRNPVFVYHKYDSAGNIQLYSAHIEENKWIYHQVTNWDYRWEFAGRGGINREL